MSNKQYIVVCGGGTGGHLKVAKTFIDELVTRGFKIIYIGSVSGQDKMWFENYDNIDVKIFLQTKGVVNQGFFGKFKSLFAILKLSFYVRKLLKEYDVKSVLSVGGFSAAPAVFATFLSGTNLFIHEQNSKMGALNKISSIWAKKLFTSYSKKFFLCDYPVDGAFFKSARIRKEIKSVIFLGGSQGARALNNFALYVAKDLTNRGIKIIHQCGKNDFKKVEQEYLNMQIDVELFDFSTNLVDYISKADFAVSRAGASTLWELCANNLPTLFIPYPYAASDHQYHNALFLKEKKLGFVLREKELDANKFLEILDTCDVEDLSKRLQDSIKTDGASRIVELIVDS
ncbi:undecaprenyldiphospho-muramoylpentapeptide beta-N-acetylglucosaminyltransferase [Arcobacter sp. FWKO B]|uniref:undecaprenyldiphospho-muramoylpentapeptide beta-N-acetylglucosaminyltransferase n=1 Tax=Arcobacter sp. FWKO B TaxID=2593672 RepID=UPI0018A492D7|nr:undecaprenyldiphospho-muramoylpentapeptide beta-N-acetylglucosaminyltransferase [Arcobacter sp. FWKO B]QOG12659.1 undecaprenyldiphospho-muramoylpentapeptide beta-N-acetylglucosaminyltransferase [Arcobacter sp. FWKO B]